MAGIHSTATVQTDAGGQSVKFVGKFVKLLIFRDKSSNKLVHYSVCVFVCVCMCVCVCLSLSFSLSLCMLSSFSQIVSWNK